MSPVMVIVSDDQFRDLLKCCAESGKRVIVDFHATWCGPCKVIKPKFAALAEEFSETCVACSVDVDEVDTLAQSCAISAMPTFHLYMNGKKCDEVVGANVDLLRKLFDGGNLNQ